jgi:hypothetical protein
MPGVHTDAPGSPDEAEVDVDVAPDDVELPAQPSVSRKSAPRAAPRV